MNINLSGKIDSGNAEKTEQSILEQLKNRQDDGLVLDMKELEYISSAGLRVILRLRKDYPDIRIVNVKPEVYEILDMTGFTEMIPVEKAYREVSIEGCEEIGRGANGTIYRIDKDNVVKVYNNPDALDEIHHEREVAKLALILGVPTAISYDVVKVGDSYGSVFELLNARSFSKIIASEPEKIDWCIDEYVEMLKKIHSTLVPEGKLPNVKETAIGWARFMQDHLPAEYGEKLLAMIQDVPDDDHMIHGDYHTKNLELQNDEVLLIDMDTLSVGHPIFEFASIYNAFIGFSEYNHETVKNFLGFDWDTSNLFWKKTLAGYFETEDEKVLKDIEDKARIIGYTRLIRRSIRREGMETEEGRAEIELWKKNLLELLDKTDSLCYEVGVTDEGEADHDELDIEAVEENLDRVTRFVEEKLEVTGCTPKDVMQIGIAVEEIFINIAKYAYAPDKGKATVRVEVSEDPVTVTITFIDHGKPYDPVAKEDPDITLSAEERKIGGLGIFMTKQLMDDVEYVYEGGKNILTLKKKI